MTKWKIGTENDDGEEVYLQIWRSNGANYSHVAKTLYTHRHDEAIAEFPVLDRKGK